MKIPLDKSGIFCYSSFVKQIGRGFRSMTNNIKYDYAIFIGGFRAGPHNGHLDVIKETLKVSDYIIVVVGSSNASRNTRIPFIAKERIEMFKLATEEYGNRVLFTTSKDFDNDSKWIADVEKSVDDLIELHSKTASYHRVGWSDYLYKIALTGMSKDESSYYLNSFVRWNHSIAVQPYSFNDEVLSSSGIRDKLFNGDLSYDKMIPISVLAYIKNHINNNPEIWEKLKSDWLYESNYSSIYGHGPHTTVDSLVIQSGHILLIKRGREYGTGKFALPGGFVNKRERLRNACIRELREETIIKVPDKVLEARITESRVFDSPWRSNRAHIITHVFKIVLKNESNKLPLVKGSDDAMEAVWVPISKLSEISDNNLWFEDHGTIISEMLGINI